MTRIGVRELRLNTSQVLARVESGETFEITSRGRPVARLMPAQEGRTWEQLIEEGRIIPPEVEGDLLDLEPLEPAPGRPLPSEVLADLRADER